MINPIARSLTLGVIIGAVCWMTVSASSNQKKLAVDHETKSITINYQIVRFPVDKKPLNVNDTIYVPLRFFVEKLGFKLENYLDDTLNVAGGDVARYATQRDLLKDAMDYVGVAAPDKAVEVWSEGLRRRSAAIQYSVMTSELKTIYEKDLDVGRANWVTGMSSPWVADSQIIKKETVKDDTQIFHMQYNTATSTGESEPFAVTLTVVKEGGFWRISDVNGDASSTAYTGFLAKH